MILKSAFVCVCIIKEILQIYSAVGTADVCVFISPLKLYCWELPIRYPHSHEYKLIQIMIVHIC